MYSDQFKINQESKKHKDVLKADKKFKALLDELSERKLSAQTTETIISKIQDPKALNIKARKLARKINHTRDSIINAVEKNDKLVPLNHYRKKMMAMGIAIFGLMGGTLFGTVTDYPGLSPFGLMLGLAIGLGIGKKMDQKAFEEGRQLRFCGKE